MKTKTFLLLLIAMVLAFGTTEAKANENSINAMAFTYQYHPGLGKIAKWKANRVKRHIIKKQMKRRWMKPRHRGITIVL